MYDPKRAYQDALLKLSEIDAKLDGYANELEAIVKGLREKRDTFQFHSLPDNNGPLTGHWTSKGRDSKQFPPVMIQNVLNERLEIKDAMANALKLIPEHERSALLRLHG